MNKEIFDTSECKTMGWHDCKIYAIAFDEIKFQLLLDIDYIFDWISPGDRETNYKFMVSPALLIFENVWNLQIDVNSDLNLDIDDIVRSNPRPPKDIDYFKEDLEYDWIIQLQQGELSFCSVGYKLTTRCA